jgi:transcriptional antiterminator NusG
VENHELQWQRRSLTQFLEKRGNTLSVSQVQSAVADFTVESNWLPSYPVEQRDWLAIFTRTHHEKRVAQHLWQRGIQSFLPLYQSVRQWSHNRRVALELPLFPNYLFVHAASHERSRILDVSGVLSIVGRGNNPASLPSDEIERLRSGLYLRKCEPHPYLAAGVKVGIVAGPFAGLEGVVVRKKGGLRVVVTIDLIAQCVAVEVSAEELEPHSSWACV